jgi:hypothetical protein
MNNWFTVKVKYTKQLENGAFKRVSESYLVAAVSFTDAEARIYEELGDIIRGEFTIQSITRTDFKDLFASDHDEKWYKVKISFESATEDSDKVKKVTENFLVSAESVKHANESIKESLSTMLVDFVVKSVVESPILDVFPFNED